MPWATSAVTDSFSRAARDVVNGRIDRPVVVHGHQAILRRCDFMLVWLRYTMPEGDRSGVTPPTSRFPVESGCAFYRFS